MIGPHQGKELELILAGRKSFAVFFDAVSDEPIPEDIIPEKAFAPYLVSADIIRSQRDIVSPRTGAAIRYVCFAAKDQAWRADAYFWIVEQVHERGKTDDAFEIMIGRLLGYSEKDIQHYLSHARSRP